MVNRAEATFQCHILVTFWKFIVDYFNVKFDTEKLIHELVILSACLHLGLTMFIEQQLWKWWFFAETRKQRK